MNDDLRRPSDEASDDGSTIVRIGEVGRRNPGVCRIYREAVGELSPGLAWVLCFTESRSEGPVRR